MKIKMKIKELLILMLILIIMCALILTACGGDSGTGENSGNPGNITEAQQANASGGEQDSGNKNGEAPEFEYEYPDMDGGGADFKFYNIPENLWFYYTAIVHDDPPDDILDDAIYKRNRFVEDKFNINIKEVNMPGNDLGSYTAGLRKLLLSGDDVYDAVFVPASYGTTVGAMLTEGLFHDLREITTINLDDEWWNQTMLKEAAIGTGKSIFYAGNGINIFTLESVACILFNQDMMSNLGLELPYNTVRQGKWTYDVLQKYMKDGAQLNGAESFKWEQSGPAVYGLTAYENCAPALLAGSGEQFIAADSNGKPVLTISGERFVKALSKVGELLTSANDGSYLYANSIERGFHFEPIFKDGRALMMLGELKAANYCRDMEATFGLLPIPKLDENQSDYYSHLINPALVTVIPVTNPRTEFTGAVLDALAYVSNRDVTPVLFDISVTQKQLRNEESIEMLQLMKDSGSFEIGIGYGWTNPFYDVIRSKFGEGKEMNIASEIEKATPKINANIEKTLALFD